MISTVSQSPHHPAFAEVMSSSLTQYTAQCWSWDTMPAFGSLVSVTSAHLTLYGIVTNLETGSSDPQRLPFPYQKTEAELRADHPQIFEFLRTTLSVSIVGFKQGNNPIEYALPQTPACIHQFVEPVASEQRAAFFSSPHFLAVLFSNNSSNPLLDELLVSVLGSLIKENLLTPALFEHYYQMLTLLMANDYRRLKILLQRIESSYPSILAKTMSL